MTLSFLVIILSCLVSIHTFAFTYPEKPPIPEENGNEKQAIILVVEENKREQIRIQIQKQYPNVILGKEYNEVFSGFSFTGLKKDLHRIQNLEGVLSATPVSTYKNHIEESVPFIGGEDVRRLFDQKNTRLSGEGVKVGVIDTGVDYRHPDLRKNYKGGYDVIDEDGDPMETKANDGTATLHGTHVAGIIAANGKIKGVAPEADIIAYRALGPGGFGTSEQVIAAIEKAIEDRVDIINLSLGNSVNGPDWPTSLALNKAVEKGIVAVTSSGNSGPDVWTVGSPGTASKAISVGASTPPLKMPYLQLHSSSRQIKLTQMQGAKAWNLTNSEQIEFAKLGESSQIGESVKDKIVLMERGKIPFTEKVLNAQKAGAKAVLIYNNVKGVFAGGIEVPANIPAASITKNDGEWIKHQLSKKPSVRTIYKKEEDMLADFSSRGPVTVTWDIKPDVVAPGVAIDSTVPNGYMALQGTSMAAPHAAGVCALIKQAHPEWKPQQIKAALMNSSKPLIKESHKLYRTIEQGAGRIDSMKAVQTDLLIYPGSLAFGQFQSNASRTSKKVKLTIENHSNTREKVRFIMPERKKGLQWKLPKAFSIEANQTIQVEIMADITPSVLKGGLHEGWLDIEVSGANRKIPYLFVVDEPDYPRVMGFEFALGDKPNSYKYQLYFPGGADEMGIALYDPDSLRFVTYLDWGRMISRGVYEKELNVLNSKIEPGTYKAIVFAKKGKQEDFLEADIFLEAK
ncbi:S8 family serine peptidase [Metabacillus arenae]|uniref:S8 family serine peptidase n=1 Tax=Metabacillus arenae TaxID=2771434 RepID=UPI002963EE2D|nr:S8 family serine peptidase [Metabacillus arenae]